METREPDLIHAAGFKQPSLRHIFPLEDGRTTETCSE
jgi:hypothetical protein